MKIDSVVKDFVESYDEEVMRYLENISSDFALKVSESKIGSIELDESFDQIRKYIEGYSAYKVENKNNDEAVSNDNINEAADKFINNPDLFKECKIPYSDIPKTIQSYIEGVKSIINTINKSKEIMMLEDVGHEDVGYLNSIIDKFTDRITEAFTPVMENFVQASGYNSAQAIKNRKAYQKQVIL